MPHEWMKNAWLVLAAAGALFFVDAPFWTFGQKFIAQRSRERWILLTLELDLYALWAVARYALHWDARLVPAPWEPVLAAHGLVLTALGVGLAVWAKVRLGRWFSATFGIKPDHQLVTDGPYAVVRHPIYAGLLAALVGAALIWNSAVTLALAVLQSVPLFFHTVYEETLFEAHFGEAYRDYERRVPRLIPFFAPGRGRA